MNAKNRLIEKLLKVAKKHKILTYPVLALVAVISVFHYFFSWSTGAGKRVVAVIMVLVMLVSQSYFLTSSATALVDTEETVQEQQELQAQNGDGLIDDSAASKQADGDDLVEAEKTTELATESTSSDAVDTTETDVSVTPTEDSTDVAENGTDAEDKVYTEDETTKDDTLPEDGASDGDIPAYADEVEAAEKETVSADVVFVAYEGSTLTEIYRCKANQKDGADTYAIDTVANPNWESNADTALAGKVNVAGYVTYDGWYTDNTYSTSVDVSNLSVNAEGLIYVYAKRIVENYKLSFSSAGNVTYDTTAEADGTYKVPASAAGNSFSGIYKVIPTRTGYVLDAEKSGYDPNQSTGGVLPSLSGNTLTITLTGDDYQKNIRLAWSAEDYEITYATTEGGAGSRLQTVTYDGTDSSDVILSADAVGVEEKEGYVFAGWKTDGGAITIPKDSIGSAYASTVSGLQAYAYNCAKVGSPAVLEPYYEYSGVKLNKEKITYEYRSSKLKSDTIIALYEGSGESSDTFTYALGTIKDGTGSDVADPASTYGINVGVAANGKAITVGTGANGPSQVVTLNVEVLVTDSRVTETGKETSKEYFTIVVNRCKLELDTTTIMDLLTKTYDGTKDCKLTADASNIPAIPTNVDGVSVIITGSIYESADAGTPNVILTRAASGWLQGDSADNYIVTENSEGNLFVQGVINQREVDVETYVDMNGKSYIRAGEANPDWGAKEIETNKSDEGLIAQDKGRLNELVSLTTNPARNDSKLEDAGDEQVYLVVPAESADGNYKFNYNYNDLASFTVRLESANALFEAIGKKESGWYGKGSKILPKASSGYDSIREKGKDASDAILLTEEYENKESITFQLYDETTKAYTAYTTIPIQVDLTAPTYVGCEVVENGLDTGSGLYFPSEGGQVSLGHYYNKSITFKVTYRDEGSDARKLVYSLSGNLTDLDGASGQEIGYASQSGNESVFTFTIPVKDLIDQQGGIQFYAIDGAENASDVLNLVSAGDQWIVEKTAPKAEMVIKAGGTGVTDGITITGEETDVYYGKVKAYLSAEDSTSPIESITWIINGEEHVQTLDSDKKQINTTLAINADSFTAQEDGTYTVSAYVTDKAGNKSLETSPVTFKVDDVLPAVTVLDGYDSYQKEVTLYFNAYDVLSGIKYINVKDAETGEMIQHKVESVEKNEDGYMTSYCYVHTTEKGSYIIEVSDNAGNVYTETIVLDKVSDEIPACPEVTFSPEINENGWITAEEATAIINNVKETVEDKIPVDTRYQLWKDGETSMHVTTLDSEADVEKISLLDGRYVLRVWTESATGVFCEGSSESGHEYAVQVDSVAPEIAFELQKGTDNSLVVNFTVKDITSGVNSEKIQVFNGSYPVVAQVTALEDGSGYSGSFAITEVGNYSIVAEDIAGNEAVAPAFRPMSMKVNAVKNISDTTATVGARIIKGTYDIKSASISYRKFDDKTYTETDALPVVNETTGNQSISAVLNGLQSGINYVYKITAISEAGEVLEYVGYFRTLSGDEAGITVTGTARYADGHEGYITVGLFEGNACIRAVEVDTSVGNTFTFKDVPDGNYSVVATDGVYSKTKRLLIKDGSIIYPDQALDLVLSGKNTSVVITTDDTPHITADNLDSLFYDETNYTETDEALVEDGNGTVEFRLYATLMKVSEVTSEEISAMYSAASNRDKLVGAYLDLSLYKIVTDADGNVTKTRVTELGGGSNISVTIPLGDLANKSGLEVIRIHDTGERFLGSYLADQDNNASTYTIVSSQYSTYAILYDPEKEPASTEAIKDGTLDPSDDGKINVTTENSNEDPDEDDPTTEELSDGNGNSKNPATGGSSVGSLRSSGSAKTGDATPIVMLFGMMLVSIGGFVVLRKKAQD